MTLYLFEITTALIEVEAEDKEKADEQFDRLIAPIAAAGTVGYYGPKTEAEYEAFEAERDK